MFFDRYPFLSPQGVGLPHTFCDVQFIEHYHKDVDLFVEVGLTMGKYLREPPTVLPMRLKTYIENFQKKTEKGILNTCIILYRWQKRRTPFVVHHHYCPPK